MNDPEIELSPDGKLRIEYEVSEMRASQWIRAPRVVRVSDAAVLLDLWGTLWDGTASYPTGDGALFLELRCYLGDTEGFTLRLHAGTATFAFSDRIERPEPLGSLRARLEERHLDQTRARTKKRE